MDYPCCKEVGGEGGTRTPTPGRPDITLFKSGKRTSAPHLGGWLGGRTLNPLRGASLPTRFLTTRMPSIGGKQGGRTLNRLPGGCFRNSFLTTRILSTGGMRGIRTHQPREGHSLSRGVAGHFAFIPLEATTGFEPVVTSFADLRLTTWLRRLSNSTLPAPPCQAPFYMVTMGGTIAK